METETMKKGEFDPECVTKIYDELHAHSYALRAFGALLQSSHLDAFTDEGLATKLFPEIDTEAQNLRWGLSQIIELYLAHQEQILAGYCDQYYESDIYLIRKAENVICMIEQGGWSTREETEDRLRVVIKNLDTVINRGGELTEKAVVLKETCLKYWKRVTEKETR
jgi:hypothetical protein